MRTPKGWNRIETGGGCTALARAGKMAHSEWLITDEAEVPDRRSDPCTLSFYYDGSSYVSFECASVTEALAIVAKEV